MSCHSPVPKDKGNTGYDNKNTCSKVNVAADLIVPVQGKDHVKDLHELSVEDRNAFMDDVCRVGKALEKVFNAQSINYGIFNDLIAHLHVHLVPKYQGGPNWGGTFDMAPKRTFLSPAGYERVIGEIRAELSK